MEDDPILLPFIDYTEKFKNAMRNWEIPIITEKTSTLFIFESMIFLNLR